MSTFLLSCNNNEPENKFFVSLKPELNSKINKHHWEIKKIKFNDSLDTNWFIDAHQRKKIPYLILEPVNDIETEIFIEELLDGIYIAELDHIIGIAKKIKFPIFINFLPLSKFSSISGKDYKDAYEYISNYATEKNIENIYWIFEIIIDDNFNNLDYFPGKSHIKWASLNTLENKVDISSINKKIKKFEFFFPKNLILGESVTNSFETNSEFLHFLKNNQKIIGIEINENTYTKNLNALLKDKIFNQKNETLQKLNNIENVKIPHNQINDYGNF